MRKWFFPLLAICLLFSCSRSEPTIAFGVIRLVRYGGERETAARYTFFILPDDDDGMEDLSDLYLYHDRAGLYWHIPAAEWVEIEFEGKFWIGSRDIAPPPGENLPRGQFRAVLVDQGGEKSERSFTFDAPAEPRFPFPVLVILDGEYTVTSSYPANHLIFYDASGAEISVKTLVAATGSIDGLSPPNGAVGAALWGEDAEYSSAAITDIVPLRRIR